MSIHTNYIVDQDAEGCVILRYEDGRIEYPQRKPISPLTTDRDEMAVLRSERHREETAQLNDDIGDAYGS